MNTIKYCESELEKAGIFSKYPNAIKHWLSFKNSKLCRTKAQAETETENSTIKNTCSTSYTNSKIEELKSELNIIYFQIDSLTELYTMQEKQLKGNVSEKQRLTIKNGLLSKAIRIQKLESKAEKIERELNYI